MRTGHRFTFSLFVGAATLAVGCSLINAYDDVKVSNEVDAAPTNDATVMDAGVDGSSDATTMNDADGTVTTTAGGLIVIGSSVRTDGGSYEGLTVLDPTSGGILAREQLYTIGLTYDGVSDVWYIFEQIAPTNPDSMMHVRTWNFVTKGWNPDLATLAVPRCTTDLATLRNRVAYVSLPSSGDAGTQLVVIDTSQPDASAVVSMTSVPNVPSIATPNPGGVGGGINFYELQCTRPDAGAGAGDGGDAGGDDAGDSGCSVEGTHVTIASGTTVNVSAPVTVIDNLPLLPEQSALAFSSYVSDGAYLDLIAVPPAVNAGQGVASLYQITPSTLMNALPQNGVLHVNLLDNALRLGASDCFGSALLASVPTVYHLYAVPLNGSKITDVGINFPGTAVLFEPFTSTAIVPYVQDTNTDISAFSLSNAGGTTTLKERMDWNPPTDIGSPIVTAVRKPYPFDCPD